MFFFESHEGETPAHYVRGDVKDKNYELHACAGSTVCGALHRPLAPSTAGAR